MLHYMDGAWNKLYLHSYSPITNHTVLPITDFYYTQLSFADCFTKNPLQPCIIHRGCYNSTVCLRTYHYQPLFSYGITNPQPSTSPPPPIITQTNNPIRIIYRPIIHSTTIIFTKQDFLVTTIILQCAPLRNKLQVNLPSLPSIGQANRRHLLQLGLAVAALSLTVSSANTVKIAEISLDLQKYTKLQNSKYNECLHLISRNFHSAYELAIQTQQQLKLLSAAAKTMDDNIRQLHVDLQDLSTRFSDSQLLYSCQQTQTFLTVLLKTFLPSCFWDMASPQPGVTQPLWLISLNLLAAIYSLAN